MVLHERVFEQLNGRGSAPAPSSRSSLMQAVHIALAGFDGWRNDIEQLVESRGVGRVVCAW